MSFCISELILLVDELQAIKTDAPRTHPYLLMLDNWYCVAVERLPQIILFMGRNNPKPKVICDFFKQMIDINNFYWSEKERITENTPEVYLETNDLFSLN